MRLPSSIAGPRVVGQDAPRSGSAVSLRRTTSLTIVLLCAVAAAAVYGILRVPGENPSHQQVIIWSTCGMLVCMAIAMLLIGRHITERSLLHIEKQLRMLARGERLDTPAVGAPEEMRRVMTALAEYVDSVRDRLDRLRLQKKEVDLQMRWAEAQHRHTEAIIFSISEAVLVIDIYGELVLANTAAERLFEFRSAECRHRPIERVLADSSLIALMQEARAAAGSNPRRQVEYSAIRNGRTQTFNITLSAVVDAESELRGLVAVFHDVTREREIAQIKTDFVSAVSHELRTPLSSIRAYIEMLLDDEARDTATRTDFYRIIESETDRLQRLISKILDISRIESGVMEIHRTRVAVNDVVREVLDMSLPQAAEMDVTVACELGEPLPAIEADRDLLYQAVQNVIGNAIKYSRRGGSVTVRTAVDADDRRLTVAVADNGMGIRAEDLPRIFDKFFRARDGARAAKGTGLGLNLVKQIVETVHHGEISVASEHGVGTTVVLRFPLNGIEVARDR